MSRGCTHCGTTHAELPRCPITGAIASRVGPCGRSIDRYDIERWVGGGGFASVYRARQRAVGRTVAVKLLRDERLGSEDHVERLLRESRAGAAIQHPNVIEVYDAGLSKEGLPFVVMELVEGVDLGTLLKQRPVLPPGRAVKITLQVLDAVAAAHEAGVLHRDIKPGNVMLEGTTLDGTERADRVKLLDFGIASLAARGLSDLTDSGAVLGTPGYMAPEQLLSARAADARADVYAVAVLLFRTLTGRLPFEAESYAQLVLRVCSEPAPPLESRITGLKPWLYRAVDRGLATDRDARWPTARRFASALRAEPITAVETTAVLKIKAPRSRETVAEDGQTVAQPFGPHFSSAASGARERGAFVGRASQLAEIERRFDGGQRLVTILGPGGMGKTRLAERFARLAGPAVFVDLSEHETLAEVARAVAQALGARGAAAPNEAVREILAHRNGGLVVLDNFEQVVGVAAEALQRWTEAAPGVRFLVTSRQRLAIEAEHALELPPLGLPETVSDPLASDAVRLLVDRVTAHAPSFDAQPEAQELAALARLLEGIPLAIELAAPRLAELGARALRERIEEGFDALGHADASTGRHRTLQAAIAWSWELLDADERSALAQCSVFRGGFAAAAAEAVVALDGDGRRVLETLGRLRDKSMLYVTPTVGPPRLACYQSIRDFAGARLADAGATGATKRRHAEHYLEECHWIAEIDSDAEPARMRRLVSELDNLMEALRTIVLRDPITNADAILASMGLTALVAARKVGPDTGSLLEVFEQVRARIEPALPAHLTPRVLIARARLSLERGTFAEAGTLYERAFGAAMAIGDTELAATSLHEGGLVVAQTGRLDEAISRIERSLEMLGPGHDGDQPKALARLGVAQFVAGNLERAAALFEEAIPPLERAGEAELLGMAIINYGNVLLAVGRDEDAEGAFRRAIEIGASLGNPLMEAFAKSVLGSLLQARGELEAAARWLDEAMTLADPHPTYHRSVVAGYRALLFVEQGRAADARAQLDIAAAKLEREGDRDRAAYLSFRAVLRSLEGAPEDTERQLDALLEELDEDAYVERAIVEAQRGHALLARARQRPDEAPRLRAEAEALSRRLMAPGPNDAPAPVDTYLEARLALRILREALAA